MKNSVLEANVSEAEALSKAKELFGLKLYDKAAKYYLIAVSRNPTVSTTYSNLAMCYYFENNMDQALEYCEKAINLNPNNLKALIYYSKAQANLCKLLYDPNKMAMVEKALQKAYSLASHPENQTFRPVIKSLHNKNKLLKHYKGIEKKNYNINKLKSYYLGLKNEFISFYINKYLITYNPNQEIPECLACPITLDFFNNPVVTSSGNTYEKQYLLDYLKVKNEDPLSRSVLNSTQIYENKPVRLAVKSFQKKHPWSLPGNSISYYEIYF
jgi:tetratricopeptide (TPR) repeat protein